MCLLCRVLGVGAVSMIRFFYHFHTKGFILSPHKNILTG
jgi:hypothetical protein